MQGGPSPRFQPPGMGGMDPAQGMMPPQKQQAPPFMPPQMDGGPVQQPAPPIVPQPPTPAPKPMQAPPFAPPSMDPAQPAAAKAPTGDLGAQNRVKVHNPTGIGTQQASQVAAAKRPIPSAAPKAQGLMGPPVPQRAGVGKK